MEISVCATSPLPRPPKPLSSHNSAFFSNGRTALFTHRKTNCLVMSRHRPQKGGLRSLTTKCLFGLGVPELAVIAGVAALVFGPKKLPEVGKSLGKTIKSFQQAAKEFESELKKEPESGDISIEKPTAVSEEKPQETKPPSTEKTL